MKRCRTASRPPIRFGEVGAAASLFAGCFTRADRVLGFGFGSVKGMIIVVMAFSILVLGYDTVWGVGGRPTWITQARTYPFVNASSEAMVTMIAERRQEAADAELRALGQKR